MIKIAIVEDSEEDAALLSRYCLRYEQEKAKQFHIDRYENGFDFMTADKADYDIILLDIRMPYMNGLQTAKKIRESNENVCIVFITNMQQYAIHGYAVRATDFLVKPLKYGVFSFKFDRILHIVEGAQGQTIVIRTGRAMKYLKLSDILFVETQKHKVIYHTLSGDYETWGTMKEVCDLIRSPGFALCNSSYFVNLRHVDELDGSCVSVHKNKLPISRLKRKDFINALTTYARNSSVINAGAAAGETSDGDIE